MVALTSMIASPFFFPMLFSSRAWPLLLLSKAATKKRRRDYCGPHSAETFRYAANLALNAEAVNKSNGVCARERDQHHFKRITTTL
jgi:hypothetical protein